jgi:hypothetical protein
VGAAAGALSVVAASADGAAAGAAVEGAAAATGADDVSSDEPDDMLPLDSQAVMASAPAARATAAASRDFFIDDSPRPSLANGLGSHAGLARAIPTCFSFVDLSVPGVRLWRLARVRKKYGTVFCVMSFTSTRTIFQVK